MQRCKESRMKSWGIKIVLFFVYAGLVVGCVTTAKTDGSGVAAGSAVTSPREIAPDASCGKCGMFPARYPQWHSQILYTDGTMVPFDGCKCMFNYLFAGSDKGKEVAALWVKDFSTGAWINGKSAHYVIGSSIMGPMGKELIPFADSGSAMAFQKEHGGQLATFDSITPETMKPLMGHSKMGGHEPMMGGKHRM